jgi:hypothetical protein
MRDLLFVLSAAFAIGKIPMYLFAENRDVTRDEKTEDALGYSPDAFSISRLVSSCH